MAAGARRCAPLPAALLLCAVLAGPILAGSGGPNTKSGAYALEFSRISAGAATRWSRSYAIEDTISAVGPTAETQRSATYSVAGPLAAAVDPIDANNGLALGQGTVINLKWSEAEIDQLPGDQGYLVHRMKLSGNEGWVQLNTEPLPDPRYLDRAVETDGFYVYYVEMKRAGGELVQWTGVFYSRWAPTPLELRRHLLGVAPLAGEKLQAADINEDGDVDVADLIGLTDALTGGE